MAEHNYLLFKENNTPLTFILDADNLMYRPLRNSSCALFFEFVFTNENTTNSNLKSDFKGGLDSAEKGMVLLAFLLVVSLMSVMGKHLFNPVPSNMVATSNLSMIPFSLTPNNIITNDETPTPQKPLVAVILAAEKVPLELENEISPTAITIEDGLHNLAGNKAIPILSIPFKIAIEKAGTEKKYLLLKFGAKWCTPCKVMEETVFKDQTVKQILEKEYLTINIDVDDIDGINLKQRFEN